MVKRDDERGVALLTVLLMVAVMAALSVALLDDIRFAIRRTTNSEAVGQARWYALGAEEMARARIARMADAGGGGAADWQGQVMRFPVDGGIIETSVADGANCFNLNSLVRGEGDELVRRDAGVRQFLSLAQAVGVGEADAGALAAALVDWMDSDILREPGGAEDETYEKRGYGGSGALLAEPSELRAVRGVDAAIYARLRPLVCALPTTDLSPLNVNALAPDRAVLLSAVTEGALDPAAARRLLQARPAGGWATAEAFWSQAALTPTDEAAGQLQTASRFYALKTEVTFGDAQVSASALLEDRDGRVRVAARRWGPEE